MEIGFIGLGNMGAAIATRLAKGGNRVTVYNRTTSRAEALKAHGVVVADSPAGASGGEAVITMLADDAALEATTFGERGVIGALRPGAIHISMSTITVAMSKRLDAAHRAAGQVYIAAPVFGRPDAAAAGKLFVMAAGDADAIARCQPLFDAIGQRTFVIGDAPAKANLVKLGGNFLIAAVIESLGEAVALMRKSGVDPASLPRGDDEHIVHRARLPDLRRPNCRGALPAAWIRDAARPQGHPLGACGRGRRCGADAGRQRHPRSVHQRHRPRRRGARLVGARARSG
jgi:3-hydroxyisobutyrate dehydrogenase-like beta-hydroxyacid dehydrogenase